MPDLPHLLKAAAAGDEAEVRACLASNPTLATAMTMLGAQAIHAAHFAGRTQVVELLLASGMTMDPCLAAQLGLTDRLERYLNAEPELVHAHTANGATLLTAACYWGQLDAARLLLDRGADPDHATTDGFLDIRPLGSAVATADTPNPSDDEATVVALVTLLLDRGADVNGRRKDGLTALHAAAYRGHCRVIALLLERGADATITGHADSRHAGETAADVAKSQGQKAAEELLRRA